MIELTNYHYFFIGAILLLSFQRISELFISKRNEKYLKEKGAIEISDGIHFTFMKICHTLWLFSCLLETLFSNQPNYIYPLIFIPIFLVGQALRILAIKSLGKRWNVKIFIIKDFEVVNKGIFKYIKHPNYLGVILELFSFPLIFGLHYTAIIFSIFNALVLRVRIKVEEEALIKHTNYSKAFENKERFYPKKN